MATYRRPGLLLQKERNRQLTAVISSTQRFPCFVGIGRPTINVFNEAVVRGLDDNPANPAQSPRNGQDSLTRPATALINVESAPGMKDFILNLDYILTDGKVDWGPQSQRLINRENSTPVDATYQIVIGRPNAGTLNRVVNFSTFQSAELMAIGLNAVLDTGTNTIIITLAHSTVANGAGNGLGTESDNSLVITGDTQGKFTAGNRIPFSQAFSADKQWKFDPTMGKIISYDTTDATLASTLNADYFYVTEYIVTNASTSPDGLSFILDPVSNATLPTFTAGDYIEVDYISVQDGREPNPGVTYYVSYTGVKTDQELNPSFYDALERIDFQADYGLAEEFLNGNQIALVGEIQFTLGTQGFFVSPVRADNIFEFGAALQRTAELRYDDLVVLTDELDVKSLTRQLALQRSSPEKKLRTIAWFAAAPDQDAGVSPDSPGNNMAQELEVLRHERMIYVATQRKAQRLLIDIPRADGTVTTDVEVPVYWSNVAIVNAIESFGSPSNSALRTAIQLFSVNPELEQYTPEEADLMAANGVMILEDNLGSLRIRDDITTMSILGTPDEAEFSVRTAEDALIGKIIEPIMDRQLIGTKITDRGLIRAQARDLLNALLSEAAAQQIIAGGQATRVDFNPKDPRELIFEFEWTPIFTLKKLTGTYVITLPTN